MISQAVIFLITTIGGLFTLALLLRFLLQLWRAPARNQLSEFLNAVTNFMVRPARRVIPGLWGLDLATLTLAWLTEVAQIWAVLMVKGYEFGPAVGAALAALAALAVIELLKLTIYIVMFAVVLQAILSWVNPYSPLAPVLAGVTQPFMRPLQTRVPTIANVDLSPLIVLIICQLLLTVPLAWLEKVAGGLL